MYGAVGPEWIVVGGVVVTILIVAILVRAFRSGQRDGRQTRL